jgi:hypothetical protein
MLCEYNFTYNLKYFSAAMAATIVMPRINVKMTALAAEICITVLLKEISDMPLPSPYSQCGPVFSP